jgi:hypothetical protein
MNLKGTHLCHRCYKWLRDNTDDQHRPIQRSVPVDDPIVKEEPTVKIDDFDWSKEFVTKGHSIENRIKARELDTLIKYLEVNPIEFTAGFVNRVVHRVKKLPREF